LLQGVEDLTVLADEMLQIATDDLDGSAVTIDVDVDVPVEVRDVEQLLQEVGGDVAFTLQIDLGHHESSLGDCFGLEAPPDLRRCSRVIRLGCCRLMRSASACCAFACSTGSSATILPFARSRSCLALKAGVPGAGLFRMTQNCCPIVQRFEVVQYTSTPKGNATPETAKTIGRTYRSSFCCCAKGPFSASGGMFFAISCF